MSETILIADDDVELCELLAEYLGQEGFNVRQAHDGAEALRKAGENSVDAVILDVMMPEMSGIEVLKSLRQHSAVPVIMLTARSEDLDRILGLELGADDYLPKPCNPRELVARIRAVFRRAKGRAGPGKLVVAELELDPGTREVRCDGRSLDLTSTEFSVLRVLLEQPGVPVDKRDLYLAALGREPVRFDRSIDMHVSNLRRKLDSLEEGRHRIETVRGVGYQYCVPADQRN